MNLGFAHALLNPQNSKTKHFKFTSLGATSHPVCSYGEVPPPDAILQISVTAFVSINSTNHSPV